MRAINLREGYTLILCKTGKMRDGRPELAYRLGKKGENEPIFEGRDYYPSASHRALSNESAIALLQMLLLVPQDTQAGLFDGYTERQLNWALMNADFYRVLWTAQIATH